VTVTELALSGLQATSDAPTLAGGYTTFGAQVAAGTREGAADVGHGAVAVVGQHLDHQGHLVRGVALVREFFEGQAFAALAGGFGDGALNIFLGHVRLTGFVDCQSQPEVGFHVAAAFTGGDGNFAQQPGEQGAALCVVGAFCSLDGGPLGMT